MFHNLQNRSDKNLLSLLNYSKHLRTITSGTRTVCGLQLDNIIASCEYEIERRIPVKHLWNIECLQRNNNITPSL